MLNSLGRYCRSGDLMGKLIARPDRGARTIKQYSPVLQWDCLRGGFVEKHTNVAMINIVPDTIIRYRVVGVIETISDYLRNFPDTDPY